MNTLHFDYTIIGGGIIGLFTAFELVKSGKKNILLLEKNSYFGDETTGRNSCVLHAGIYYPQDSLKHQLCIEGNKLWREYSKTYSFPINLCGKYVIASKENDLEKLEEIWTQANLNRVLNIRRCHKKDIELIKDQIHVKEAFFSKNSGIINTPEVVKSLRNFLEIKDVILMKEHQVDRIIKENNGFTILFKDYQIKSLNLINCAGLNSINIRKNLGLKNLENKYVKGNYVNTSQKLNYKFLYYPVPEENLKGLGVHSTLDFSGKIRFGPNTEDVDKIDYNLKDKNLTQMKEAIVKTFKNIDEQKLYLDFCGIRPKIIKDGRLFLDFHIESPIENYVEACGIESPGLTAAPAIAKKIKTMIIK